MSKQDAWNRCDECGQFIGMADIESGKAVRRMTTPDSDYSCEDYETLCPNHATLDIVLSTSNDEIRFGVGLGV